jgi:superfamily II RNA helicase
LFLTVGLAMQYRGFTLDPFQETAIGHLANGTPVLVAAPTGTGKTIIADWAVDEAMKRGQQVIYTAPIKALSNQKFRDYVKLHGEHNVGLVTGDLVIRRQAPCLVMTTEILRNMLLGDEDLSSLYAVVVDEVHFLDDRERGTVWEEILIYLPEHVLIVALSATLPNLEDFSAWLSRVRGKKVEVVTETRRAVPLDFHFITKSGGLMNRSDYKTHVREAAKRFDLSGGGRGRDRFRGRRDRRGKQDDRRGGSHKKAPPQTRPIDALKELLNQDWLPALYFVFSRKDAERFARSIAHRFRVDLLDDEEKRAVQAHLDTQAASLGPALDRALRDMYMRGIAFHHAGVHVQLKTLVEELYEKRLIKLLFCTSTFALGINMPARSVVFHGLEKFDGQAVRPLPTRGFMQKAGRAGRRGFDEAGHVVIRMDPQDYDGLAPHIARYLNEDYEPVRSSFSLSWNSIVNLLDNHSLDHVRTVVDRSFLTWERVRQAREQLGRADRLEQGKPDRPPTKRDLKEARRLRRRADKAEERSWIEFLQKRDYLRFIGYLAEDDSFNAGAKVLRHLQIAEIMTTELVLSGLLEELDDNTLFGVMCSVCSELPRSVRCDFRVDRKDRELARRIQQIRMSPHVTEAEHITGQETTFSPDMMVLGRSWANGDSLETITMMVHSPTDFTGTLVGALRRAKDLTSQLVDVYAGDPDRAASLRALVKLVSRDEVEVVG